MSKESVRIVAILDGWARMVFMTMSNAHKITQNLTVEDRLDRIERKLDALLAHLKVSVNGGSAAKNNDSGNQQNLSQNTSNLVSLSDADLDSPRGNPEVRFVPKRWTGEDFKGRRFSETSPEFLDLLADALEYFAKRDDETNAVDSKGGPKSKWTRLDAARARGWSQRLRNRPASSNQQNDLPDEGNFPDDEIPF